MTTVPLSAPLRPGFAGCDQLEPPLRVTQVSTSDEIGGAARATHRLHRALRVAGVESRMLVAHRRQRDARADVVELNAAAPAPAFLGQALFRLGRRWHRPPVRRAGAFFTFDWSCTGWRLPSQLPETDVLNLHWVADLLDYRTLPRLAGHAPVVWTFHDMNAFTGGCHYSGGCERFRGMCGACPQLATSDGEWDLTRRVLLRKQAAFARLPRDRFVVVCPSAWLAAQAGHSVLLQGCDIRVIPNGIDTREFSPVEKGEARRRLRLPANAKIVLFVADSVTDQRKGLPLLRDAVAALRTVPGILVVTLGRNPGGLEFDVPCRHLGELSDAARLRDAYGAADVFAIPTREDNLPNTILEAMACGTPVVGFRVGGVGEAIVDRCTGLLAEPENANDLAVALRRMLTDGELRRTCADNGRRRAEVEYGVELQAQRYLVLYEELRERRSRSGETEEIVE